jgi:hypothetical protein
LGVGEAVEAPFVRRSHELLPQFPPELK